MEISGSFRRLRSGDCATGRLAALNGKRQVAVEKQSEVASGSVFPGVAGFSDPVHDPG